MKKISEFFRNEKMMSIAIVLALLSQFISPLTGERIVNLSWKTLASLFMLFLCLEGFKKEKLFNPIERILGNVRSSFALSFLLILVIFVLSSLITNDVALLSFVPITLMIFRKGEKEQYLPSIVVLETISANLGSMLTPFGNPQNLFLFDKADLSASSFILSMLPLWLVSLILIVLSLLFVFRKDIGNRIYIVSEIETCTGNRSLKVLYVCMFILTLSTILGAFETFPILLVIAAITLVFDREALKKIDWPLLLTFLCFFIFSSSIASNKKIASMLSAAAAGHEFSIGLILSQIISNVPAAILLEPFTDNLKALLFGVDVGGLGSPVASLASLISLRLFFREEKDKKNFLKCFSIWNIAFLIILIPTALLLLHS